MSSRLPVEPSKVPAERDTEFYQIIQHLQRNRLAMLGVAILTVFMFGALFAPVLTSFDPVQIDFGNAFQKPSPVHILGADELGRDVFARILFGSRISLMIGFISVFIGLAAGVPIGALSGYYGGKIDLLVQRLIDMLIAFPGILLAIVIVTVLGTGVENVMLATGIASVPIYTRLVRGSVLAVKEQRFVAAAKVLGISSGLIKSKPKLSESKVILDFIPGMVPNPVDMPPGCAFNPRCRQAMEICRQQTPVITEPKPGHLVRCWLYDQSGVELK